MREGAELLWVPRHGNHLRDMLQVALRRRERGQSPGVFVVLAGAMLLPIRAAGLPWITNRVGSMFTLFMTDAPVRNWDDAARCDTAAFGAYFSKMLVRGMYLAPSQFEAAFLSNHEKELRALL